MTYYLQYIMKNGPNGTLTKYDNHLLIERKRGMQWKTCSQDNSYVH